jgi:hypothetical protein
VTHALSPDRCIGDLPRFDRATFEERFRGRMHMPAIVTGLADAWPARERWTHDVLLRELALASAGVAKSLTPELAREVAFPSVARIVQQTNVWIFADANVSALHFDLPHNLNTVLRGEKDVVLFHPRETKNLYPSSALGSSGPQNSRVDLDRIDDGRFPRVRDARYWQATVREGETLYIPPCHWHFVRSRGESVAVNVWFHEDDRRLRRIARWPLRVIAAAAIAKLVRSRST